MICDNMQCDICTIYKLCSYEFVHAVNKYQDQSGTQDFREWIWEIWNTPLRSWWSDAMKSHTFRKIHVGQTASRCKCSRKRTIYCNTSKPVKVPTYLLIHSFAKCSNLKTILHFLLSTNVRKNFLYTLCTEMPRVKTEKLRSNLSPSQWPRGQVA
jgi:hypothetical protein